MSTLTMKDVAPYFAKYLEVHGEACTLSIDLMEEIMGAADSEDSMIAAMHDAMTSTDDEVMTGRDVTVADLEAGSAYSYAIKMSKELQHDIEVLGQAALENKRGAAVIMFDLFNDYGIDTVCKAWPKPGSYKPGQGHADTEVSGNQPWDKEDTTIQKTDGTTGKGVKSFYSEFVDWSAYGKGLLDDKAEIKKDIGNVRVTKRKLSAIDTKRGNFKSSIVRAVNLAQKMAFVNAETGMHCEVEMDDDDRSKVAASNKIVFIQDKSAQTKFDTITIGQFLALKVIAGATYSAIVGTVARKPRQPAGAADTVVPEVNSLDTFDKMTASYATFFDKIEEALSHKDQKAYNALLTRLNAAGSDDILLSLNKIMNFAEGLLSKPGISKRLADLIADGGKKETKAA